MRLAAPSVLIVALLALAGCGSQAPQAPPQAPPAQPAPAAPATAQTAPKAPPMGQVFADYPFTPEQIRDASPSGRHVVFRIQQAGGELRQEMTFTDSDEQGTLVKSVMTMATGESQSGEQRSTWQQLQAHASYPASFTTIQPVEVEVPAGTFAAKLYEVGDGQGGVRTRVWFADELPGPPVRMEMYTKGERDFEMVMLEHHPGGEPPAE